MEIRTFSLSADGGWPTGTTLPADSDRTFLLAFAAPSFFDRPAAFRELRRAYPRSPFVGCSTAGEIHGTRVKDGTISVAVVRLAGGSVRSAEAPIESAAQSFAVGARLATALAGPALRGVLVFCDGLVVNGSELVRGVRALLPERVAVSGGLAGDGDRFQRTWVVSEGKPKQGFASALGLYGAGVRIGCGSMGGWDNFGVERRITKSSGNVLYELDGKAALHLYKRYLGARAAGLPATAMLFPLAIRRSPGEDQTIVRTIVAVDEAAQSITFAGDVPEGGLARLMMANFDRLVEGASSAAQGAIVPPPPGAPVLAVAVSCVGRRIALGERTEEETEATLEALPEGAEQIGFYSYGEIGPGASGHCDLHNQTMTLTTVHEA